MADCPYCNTHIDETYNFCVSCEQQIKCLACGSLLVKDKSKCLKCGVSLDAPQASAAPVNRFSLEEQQTEGNYSRKIDLSFTDTAIDKVASVLNGYVPLNSSQNIIRSPEIRQQLALPFLQTPEVSSPDVAEKSDKTVETSARESIEEDSPSFYFEKDGEGLLMSRIHDYKGGSKKLQQQRFIILYVWAYNALEGEPVPNENLAQAARRNGMYDKHFPTYIKEAANRFFVKLDGSFKLNLTGKIEVDKIKSEMQDPDSNGFEYWNSAQKRTSRSSRATKEDSQKLEQWLQGKSRFDDFDVRKLSSAYEFAILALYDITKEINVENSVKPALAYDYLVKRYRTIPIEKKLFTQTLSRKRYEGYFKRTPNGSYYLTQEGEKLVQDWIS
jgi:hypothetical protein